MQVDFGKLGLVPDPATGKRRVVHGLIFTAVYSRYMFVYPTYRQTLDEVIAGFECAWAFFGGVFAAVIPDNMKAIVDSAHATEPRLNERFREYAQARGFVVDPTRVRSPQDKPRVESMRELCDGRISLPEKTFATSTTADNAPRLWCRDIAGSASTALPGAARARCSPPRRHPKLRPAPAEPFDLPT